MLFRSGQLAQGYVARSLSPIASMARFAGRATEMMNLPVLGDMMFPQSTGSAGSLETLEGARAAGLLDRYSASQKISSGVTPPVSATPKVVVLSAPPQPVQASSGTPASQNILSFNAVHPEGNRRTAQILGVS